MNIPEFQTIPKVSFWLRPARKGYFVVCELNQDNIEERFQTGIKINKKSEWNDKTKTLKDATKEALRLQIANDINQIISYLRLSQKPCNPKTIVSLYKKQEKTFTVLEVFAKYIKDRKQPEFDKGELEKESFDKYKYAYNAMQKVLEALGESKRLITEANTNFLVRVEQELNKTRNASTTQRLTSLLRKSIDYAYSLELIDRNPTNNTTFTIKGKKPEIIVHLTTEELEKWKAVNFANERLNKARDFFLLMCYTGMSYADLFNFDYAKDVIMVKGEKTIKKKRKKTKTEFVLLLLPEAEELFKKYDYKVPKLRNDKLNLLIKEIAHFVGIEINLKSHIGRKTFSHLMLNVNEIPVEFVSKMLGHKTTAMTLNHYTRHSTESIIEATKHIVNKPKNEE
ncbi:MAG: tyrosine-type recombinase/integrase [Thermoflexibacter sp.]|jgi:integrase|nr:tyrosine-type recombinase/integrase [Thermoflexibacter sp.]